MAQLINIDEARRLPKSLLHDFARLVEVVIDSALDVVGGLCTKLDP